MSTHKVIFTPMGVQTTAETGESVYDIALKSGVDMQSICGGKGLCKRCQIECEPGHYPKFKVDMREDHLSKFSPTEKKAVHDGEMIDTRRLACRAKISGDVVINVPSDSREHETSIRKKSTDFTTDLNPSVTLHMIQLPVPTLEENPSDGQALIKTLSDMGFTAQPSLRVLTKVQHILAKNDRTAIIVLRDRSEIIDIWPPSDDHIYGAAIDIGSTSVALYVYDLSTGELAHEKAAMNPQIRFGEDLMSRVSYVMMNKGGDAKLTAAIREQIKTMLAGAIETLSLSSDQLLEVICVGNPIMHHIFIGADPTELGQAPFTLVTKDWLDIPAMTLDIGLSDAARVSLLPLIGGHVGADTTGAYLTQMETMKRGSSLLVDIGTNAEIILTHKGRVAACSSPTGPALEGAEISCGVRATPGAIERVRIDPETRDPQFKIIGHDEWLSDTSPDIVDHTVVGICGSGIFEVMVELANSGCLDKSGLFIPDVAPHRFEQDGKSWKYRLLIRDENPLYIKQTDVRAVQLAKAALSAGVSLLTEFLGCDAVDQCLLAGAFGTHLDPSYVAQIGIVAGIPAEKIRSIGNAAGMGAAMALLNVDEKAKIIEAVKHIEKLETATEAKFQHYFVEAMQFPTAQASRQTQTRRRRRRG